VSGGGTEPSTEEKALVTEALNKGITLVLAAGNERSDLLSHPYYPAMYDKRAIIVGNESRTHSRVPSSNWGPTVEWEIGENVMSYLPRGQGTMNGTSQATAVRTGKLVRQKLAN